jgi:hypothetical protein
MSDVRYFLARVTRVDFEEIRADNPNLTGFPWIYAELPNGKIEVWPIPSEGWEVCLSDPPYAQRVTP